MKRKGWKRGDWLVRDEESGFTEYASKVRRDYYGVLKRSEQSDPAHPQDFIRAKNDPFIGQPQNPPALVYNTSAYNLGEFVGETIIPVPFGPASHLYPPDFGIGAMTIGTTFIVR